jgi:hypothetical protein
MVWIKRNLFWVVFGGLTLVLLLGGAFYLYTGIDKHGELETKITDAKGRIDQLAQQSPTPTPTNLARAREDQKLLRAATGEAVKHFAPIEVSKVTGVEFKKVLDTTVFELRRQARSANVQLPSADFAFSFALQKDKTTFHTNAFPFLPEHLAEVKAICGSLFDSKIARLESVRRPRTMDDPPQSPDCHDLPREIRADMEMAVNFYEMSFFAFSSEISRVLNTFAQASEGLLVKAVVIEPGPTNLPPVGAMGAGGMTNNPGGIWPSTPSPQPQGQPMQNVVPPRSTLPPRNPQRPGARPNVPTPAPRAGAAAPAGAGGSGSGALVPAIREELFKVTLLLEVIKPVN